MLDDAADQVACDLEHRALVEVSAAAAPDRGAGRRGAIASVIGQRRRAPERLQLLPHTRQGRATHRHLRLEP